jgi:hypothetical protein
MPIFSGTPRRLHRTGLRALDNHAMLDFPSRTVKLSAPAKLHMAERRAAKMRLSA